MSISFLIFAASSFAMMATLIQKTTESLIGADIYAQAGSRGGVLDEGNITAFLESQMTGDNPPVQNYAFTSLALDDWQTVYFNYGSNLDTAIFDESYYHAVYSFTYAVPENFLNVTDTEFYVPYSY